MADKKQDYVINIDGNAKGLDAATQAAARSLGNLRSKALGTFKGFGEQISGIRGLLGTLAGAFTFGAIIKAATEAERAQKLIAQSLKSTGREAEFSAQQLGDYASGLQSVTTLGDEAIINAQRMLLTFKNVRTDALAPATEAAANLSEALGTDLSAAAQTVGAALNNPVRGIKLLRSVNIELTKEQQKSIKTLTEQGRVAEAQAIILKELEAAYGGTARAARDTLGGALTAAKEAFGDLLEGDGGNLKDAAESVNELTAILQSPDTKAGFASLVGFLIDGATAVASFVAKIGNLIAQIRGTATPLQEVNAELRDVNDALSKGFMSKPVKFLFTSEEDLVRLKQSLEIRRELLNAENKPAAPAGAAGGNVVTDPEDAAEEADKRGKAVVKSLQASSAAASAVFKAEMDRQKASLDAALAQNLISYQDYYAQRLADEQAAIDEEIAAREQALGKATGDEAVKLQGELEALRIQRVAAAEQSAREEAEARRKAAEETAALQQRLLEATGQGAAAQRLVLEREFDELIKRLQVNGDAGGVEIARRLFNVESARIDMDEIESEFSRLQERLQLGEQSIAARREAGLLTERESRRSIIALHQQTAAELQKLIPEYERLAEVIGDPASIARLDQLKLGILELREVGNAAFKELGDAFESAFADNFAEVLDGTATFGAALESLFKDIIRSLNRQVAEDLADGLGNIFKQMGNQGGSAGGDSGGTDWIGTLGSIFGSFFHKGGVVGEDSETRKVPRLVFGPDVPRYHSGGIAGLAADEVPAILRRREEVLTETDPRHRNNGGLMPPVNVTIVTPDAASFKASQTQIGAQVSDFIRRGMRNK